MSNFIHPTHPVSNAYPTSNTTSEKSECRVANLAEMLYFVTNYTFMTAQELLQSLTSFVSDLTFTHKHCATPVFDKDHLISYSYEHSISTTIDCNEMTLEVFQKELKNLCRDVEDTLETDSTSMTTSIKAVNRLTEDLFSYDKQYNGKISHEYSAIPYNPNDNKALKEYYTEQLLNKIKQHQPDLKKSDIKIVEFISKPSQEEYFKSIYFNLKSLSNRLENQVQMLSQNNLSTIQAVSARTKVKWKGSNLMLGFLLSQLNREGLIELPPHPNGEVHYPDSAKWIVDCFELRRGKPNMEAMEKALNEKVSSLSAENSALIYGIIEQLNKYS